jgi:hypothetical protein
MLNSILDVTAAADMRVADRRSAMGAFLPGRVGAAHQCLSDVPVFARRRVIHSGGAPEDSHAAAFSLPQGQQSVRKQYPNQARSAAAIGGALGSHPARDPV